MNEPFELDKVDLDSPLWLKIEAHLKRELKLARQRNDSLMSAEATNIIRGRIFAIKDLLKLNPNNEDI